MIRLVNIDDVRPSTYNPRAADPRRLDLVEMSLRKLGWLLPVYADANGEILSGHQRHHVAMRMGLSRVPVCFTKAMPLEERKAVNIAFNRGTNDLKSADTLVENSHEKRTPFTEQIRHERYRQWLVELLRHRPVILLTARPARYAVDTINSITEKTGWRPNRWMFNDAGLPPAECKERALLRLFGDEARIRAQRLFALESNPKTREMYERYGIKSTWMDGEVWTRLPV